MDKITVSFQELQKLIKKLDAIPTIPAIALKIIKSTEDDSITELVEALEKDQSLSAKILKVANSAYYRLSGNVSSISRAIIVLGQKELRNISTFVLTHNQFPKTDPVPGWDRTRFWSHTISVAYMAELIANKYNLEDKDFCFFSGLFHDVGRVIIDCYFHEDFGNIITSSSEKSLANIESDILGVTHSRIGEFLLRTWRIPSPICCAVRFHHEPKEDKTYTHLSVAVSLANNFCNAHGSSCVDREIIDWDEFIKSENFIFMAKTLKAEPSEITNTLVTGWNKIKDLTSLL